MCDSRTVELDGVPGSMRSFMSESERSYGISAERDGANRCLRSRRDFRLQILDFRFKN
jgi:hypothetical protein